CRQVVVSLASPLLTKALKNLTRRRKGAEYGKANLILCVFASSLLIFFSAILLLGAGGFALFDDRFVCFSRACYLPFKVLVDFLHRRGPLFLRKKNDARINCVQLRHVFPANSGALRGLPIVVDVAQAVFADIRPE